MEKARKKVKEILPSVDVVIEVLDARCPHSSTNPMIEKLRGDKPYLKVLTKTDLADPQITDTWQSNLSQALNTEVLPITTLNTKLALTIPDRVCAMSRHQAVNIRPVAALIMGVPNVGKSTLINTLVGRKAAGVGNEPAVTKAQQKYRVNARLTLIDSPGMTWPGSKDEMINYRLAASGAIRDTAIEYDDLGLFTVDYLLQRYPEALAKQYQLSDLPEQAIHTMEAIAKKRGCVKGKYVDYTRVGELIVREFRAGKIGRISLEEPNVSYAFRDN